MRLVKEGPLREEEFLNLLGRSRKAKGGFGGAVVGRKKRHVKRVCH